MITMSFPVFSVIFLCYFLIFFHVHAFYLLANNKNHVVVINGEGPTLSPTLNPTVRVTNVGSCKAIGLIIGSGVLIWRLVP